MMKSKYSCPIHPNQRYNTPLEYARHVRWMHKPKPTSPALLSGDAVRPIGASFGLARTGVHVQSHTRKPRTPSTPPSFPATVTARGIALTAQGAKQAAQLLEVAYAYADRTGRDFTINLNGKNGSRSLTIILR